MREVIVAGVGVHNFGKFIDKSLKELGRVAVMNALEDAGLSPKDIQVAFFGNAYGGLITSRNRRRGPVLGLTHNGGGTLEGDAAAMCLHILKRL